MSTIERPRLTVSLPKGSYLNQLRDLENRIMAALRREQAQTGPQRAGQGPSESTTLALEFDALNAEAEVDASHVTVYALPDDMLGRLENEHPPREDNKDDAARGVDVSTFFDALVRTAMVPDDDPALKGDLEGLITRGAEILAELGLARPQVITLKTEAWNVNYGVDALPKYSAVSNLQALKDRDSKELSEPE